MYRVYEVIDYVKIPPTRFGEPVEVVAEEYLREKHEAKFNKDLGIVILVYDVNVSDTGFILPGDGSIYLEARFKLLSYVPIAHEVVEGVVKDVRNIGLFVNIGPLDAFVHISQVMDSDDIEYNDALKAIVGDKNRKHVTVGDKVRGRITNISFQAAGLPRIAMTMRQPNLGKLEWIGSEK
ncbi:MAG: DNA-directed RNA polymerase [Desulfurococcales archaeon]|nr:DNA-directed RNA polymerase [Desulfurococcales archaeon]